jgi:hypothetical protein
VLPGGRKGRGGSGRGLGHLEPFWLLGCGSSGANPTRLGERSRRNCAMVYDFTDVRLMRGECLEYTTEAAPEVAYDFEVPLYPWRDAASTARR